MALVDRLLTMVAQFSPIIDETLRKYGDRPIKELLDSIKTNKVPPIQSREDLWNIIESEIIPFFGEKIAHKITCDLRLDPTVQTSNHYGIDTAADSIQGTLLFLLRRGGNIFNRPFVVFGFSSISMNNNFSYPMGLQFYNHSSDQIVRLPQKLPIFPNRLKKQVVYTAGPFDEKMVWRAQERLIRMKKTEGLTTFSFNAIRNVLEEIFLDSYTLGLRNYGEQACIINNKLWHRSFKEKSAKSHFIQLQIEKICKLLLYKDLKNSASLIFQLFFTNCVREKLINNLDGSKACWKRKDLEQRYNQPDKSNQGGTVFFWGLTESGHRIPLVLKSQQSEKIFLGISDRGQLFEVKFCADHIIAALQAGTIIPSLFTCFAVLAFARGIHCIGGYYQAEYLPVIQGAIVDALNVSEAFRDMAESVAQVPTRTCLAGLQYLALKRDDNSVVPIGPIELAGVGGIRDIDLETIPTLSIRDASLLAFTESLDQLVSNVELPDNWVQKLSVENGRMSGILTYCQHKELL